MTISSGVQSQFFQGKQQIIRLAPTFAKDRKAKTRNGKPWTIEEHNRFLAAIERYPSGPWKVIASCVQTRTTRQTMTHAQKYREKIARRNRALHADALFESAAAPDPSAVIAAARREDDECVGANATSIDKEDTIYGDAVDAALASFLDEYEPFDLLDDGYSWNLQFE